MRRSVLVLSCIVAVVGVWSVQAGADRPAGPRALLATYLDLTPEQWKAMPLDQKHAAMGALSEEARRQFRLDLAAAKAAAGATAAPEPRPDRPRAAASRALGTIQYDSGPPAAGAFITYNWKGNRFDTASDTMGVPGPIRFPGSITQVSAYVLPAPPPDPPGSWSTGGRFRILGAAAGGAAGGNAPVLVNSTWAATGGFSTTKVRPLAPPVTFPGPSFHVGVHDNPGWSSFWPTFNTFTHTYTYTNTYTNTFTNTFTYTFTTPSTWTSMYTTMYTTMWTSMYTTMWTTMSTWTTGAAYSYAVPGYQPATGVAHAVSFGGGNPANVVPVPGFNMMVRASGDVIVPVELMRFLVE